MSSALCEACQRINLYTLSTHPISLRYKVSQPVPPLNPSLIRRRDSLSPTCPMCGIISACIELCENEQPRRIKNQVAFLSLMALPSWHYYEQYTDKADHSALSVGLFLRLMPLFLYRSSKLRIAEARRRKGKPGLLKVHEIWVQMAEDGAKEIQCGEHQSCRTYNTNYYRQLELCAHPGTHHNPRHPCLKMRLTHGRRAQKTKIPSHRTPDTAH